MSFIALGSLCLNVLLCYFLFVRRKKVATLPAQQVLLPVTPPHDQDLIIQQGTFTLAGEAWRWIGDTPANYGCLLCGGWQEVDMRQYTHIPSGQVFALLAHQCSQCHTQPITDEIMIEKGGTR